MLKDYFTLVLRKDGLSLEQIDKGLSTFLKVKPVFTSFEHEYSNLLYGKPCSIPNMPKFTEGMANLVNNMEFIESLGTWGSLVQVPVNFIDYLLSLLF